MYNQRQWMFLIKLLSPFVAAFLTCTFGLVALLYFNGSNLLNNQLQQRVLDEIDFLTYEFQEDGPIELLEEIEERLEKNNQSWRYLYAVQSPNGAWVFDKLDKPPLAGWSQVKDLEYADLTLMYTRELPEGYRLTVGIAKNDLQTYRKAFVTDAGWLMLGSVAVSIILGALLYHRFINTLRKVTDPVQRFADGHFDARITHITAGPDLERLAFNINSMFDQIERLIGQLKKLSANIAHDLRTPLTRVKNHLTLISDSSAEQRDTHLHAAEAELEEVLRLFREILQLSEIQSGRLQTHFTDVHFAELVRNSIELYEPLLDDKNITVNGNIASDVELRGSPQLLKQVLVNLLENVLNHTDGNCSLNISLRRIKKGIVLEVDDTGEKASSNQKHFGLGLGFVSAIAELHNGSAEFVDKPQGGFRCTIRFPSSKIN